MKKVMFNDMYGLTKSVLDGRKTQTRRTINLKDGEYVVVTKLDDGEYMSYVAKDGKPTAHVGSLELPNFVRPLAPKYFIGEEVAIAQSYETIISNMDSIKDIELLQKQLPCTAEESWHNKMFVRADLMPHRIKITNIRVERLQDISDADCVEEGITPVYEAGTDPKVVMWYALNNMDRESRYETPREAYAALIDKVSGKGTWDSNPYVFVYDFELSK